MHRRIHIHEQLLAAALIFAFLPTLTFLGHWNEILGGAEPISAAIPAATGATIVDLAAQRADQAAHAMHCHADLASCSGQPMPAGVGLFATREQLLLPPRTQTAAPARETARLFVQVSSSPPTPPPRSARSFA